MAIELSQLLPPGLSPSSALYAGGFGAVFGLGLWLAGSRFGQGLVTLTSVAAGACLGKMVPAWAGWTIDPMGTAFGGALVLGILGYVNHRLWEGVGLGVLAAIWSTVGTLLLLSSSSAPAIFLDATFTLSADYLRIIWTSFPGEVRTVLPYAVGCSLVSGLLTAAIWPRVASVAFYSMLGVTVLVAAAELLGRTGVIPAGAWARVGVAVMLAGFGAVFQWWLSPRATSATNRNEMESGASAGGGGRPAAV